MAEEIGSIEARITADTSDFTRGLLAAEAEAKAFAFDVNKVGTDTNAFGDAMKYATRASDDASKAIGDAAKLIGETDNFLSKTTTDTNSFSKALNEVGDVVGQWPALWSGAIGVLTSLPVLLGLAAVALVALIDLFGTLVAIVADAIAPVTLVVGLLGTLGVGFLLAGKRASEGGGKLNEFSRMLATLHSMFDRTSSILAHVFLPYLVELAQAGEKALNFLDRIAKLPLKQAFEAIDTRGVNLLKDFVDRVAEVTARPIRLAFQIAFGDSNFSNAVSDWWHRFTGFLFGYTEEHPIKLPSGHIIIEKRTVDGIFQPLVDWFNRHNFTKQGQQIGHAILGGFTDSEASKRIGQAIIAALEDAWDIVMRGAHKKWNDFEAWLNGWIERLHNKLSVSHIFDWVKDQASNAFNHAIDAVKKLWDKFVSWIEKPFHINIDWPSPPSWLSHLPGSGILSDIGGGLSSLNPIGKAAVAPRAQPLHVHLMIGEREFGQAIIDTQRHYGRQNAGRSLAASAVAR